MVTVCPRLSMMAIFSHCQAIPSCLAIKQKEPLVDHSVLHDHIKLVAENIAENIGAIQLTLRLASAAMPLGCARLDIFDYGGGYECAMKTV